MFRKGARFLSVCLVIFGIMFSNVPFNVVSKVIDSYIEARSIVDLTWKAQKDSNVVDKFVSLRSLPEKLKIHEARAATTFINVAHYNSAASASATVNKPTNTANGDIMFAVVMRNNTGAVSAVPAGWALIGDHSYTTTYRQLLYWKLAASEGASYVWGFASSGKTAITIATYRGGFNTASPIDVVSNTAYITSNTTVRATTMNVSAPNSVLLNFATFYSTTVKTFTKPSLPTTDWVENYDGGATTSDFSRTINSMTWTGLGATGNIDTISAATGTTGKHAFAVALKPVSANSPPTLSVSEPNGTGDTVSVGAPYNVTYSLSDSDNVVTSAFYYDTNNDGVGGTAITGACATAAEGAGATCAWNTTGMALGSYYVYGVTNDGTNPAVTAVSTGMITIQTAGSLSVDIVDSGGTTVASPAVSLASKTFNWTAQQSAGTFGMASQKIRITNATASPTWTLSIAASSGNTALWTSGGYTYDFNGTASAGRLQINPSSATITPQGGCASTGLTKGATTYFAQGTQDTITLVSASGSAQTGCYWDIIGIGMTQDIPAIQKSGNYALNLLITAI